MSKIILTLIAALTFVLPLHPEPPGKPVRTYIGETRKYVMKLTLYPDKTYSYEQDGPKYPRQDTGSYREWGMNKRLKLHSIDTKPWQHRLLTEHCYVSGEGIRALKPDGKICLQPEAIYAKKTEMRNLIASDTAATLSHELVYNHTWSEQISRPFPDARKIGAALADSLSNHQFRVGLVFLEAEKQLREHARSICDGIQDDSLKFVAICLWIVNKLDYDYTFNSENYELNNLLQSGKTVCAGYAALLNALCYLQGIPSLFVTGHVIRSEKWNFIHTSGHAWNLVKINGRWYGIDLTWMDNTNKSNPVMKQIPAGEKWYLTAPEELSMTHYPEESRLSFHPCKQQPLNDYLRNPVLQQSGQALQLLEPRTNIIRPKDGFNEFYFYSAKHDTMLMTTMSRTKAFPYKVIFTPGINKFRLPAPQEITGYRFDNEALEAEFLSATGKGSYELINYFDKTLVDFYADSVFYRYLLNLNYRDSLPINKLLSDRQSRQQEWKAMLARYDGRNLPGPLVRSIRRVNGNVEKDCTQIEFIFHGELIAGRTPVLRFPILNDIPGYVKANDPMHMGEPEFDLK